MLSEDRKQYALGCQHLSLSCLSQALRIGWAQLLPELLQLALVHLRFLQMCTLFSGESVSQYLRMWPIECRHVGSCEAAS